MHKDNNIDTVFESLRDSTLAVDAAPDWKAMRSILVSEGLVKKRNKKRGIIIFLFLGLISTLFAIGTFHYSMFDAEVEPAIINTNNSKIESNILAEDDTITNNESQIYSDSLELGLDSDSASNPEGLTSLLPSSDNKPLYNVQIGAFINTVDKNKFNDLPDLIIEEASYDSFTRYYAGKFETIKEAKKCLFEMRSKGYEAFIISNTASKLKPNKQQVNPTSIQKSATKKIETVAQSTPISKTDYSVSKLNNRPEETSINKDAKTSIPIKEFTAKDKKQDKLVGFAETIDEQDSLLNLMEPDSMIPSNPFVDNETKKSDGDTTALAYNKETKVQEVNDSLVPVIKPDTISTPVEPNDSLKAAQDTSLQDSTLISKPTSPTANDSCSKWSIAIHYSKDFNSHALEVNRSIQFLNDLNKNYDQFLSKRKQFSIGASINYRINCRLSLSSGFSYSKKGQFKASFQDSSVSTIDTSTILFSSSVFDFTGNYIDIPIAAQYYFYKSNKISLYAGAGVVFNINSPFGSESTFQEVRTDETRFNVTIKPLSVNISPMAKLGLEYRLDNKFSAYLEPRYQHGLTPIVKHSSYKPPLDQLIRTTAIRIGLIYDFN